MKFFSIISSRDKSQANSSASGTFRAEPAKEPSAHKTVSARGLVNSATGCGLSKRRSRKRPKNRIDFHRLYTEKHL